MKSNEVGGRAELDGTAKKSTVRLYATDPLMSKARLDDSQRGSR